MSWNDYPKHVAQSLIKRFSKKLNEPTKLKTDNDISDDDKLHIMYISCIYKFLISEIVVNDLLMTWLRNSVVT